ncbi:MAG: hypothetical protein CMJ83_08785 [Planctomycetes bacterium]|nr:hypothetical protein [Planctomycetota bacterium]
MTIWEKDAQGRSREREGKIEQRWQKQAKRNRYRRLLSPTVGDEKPSTMGCDGQRYWRQRPGERSQDLQGDPTFRKDLDNLKEEIRRTDELMSLFFLANLLTEHAVLQLGNKDVVIKPNRNQRRQKYLVDEVVLKRPGKRTLTFRIGKQDARVYEIHLAALKKGDPVETFAFFFHLPLKDKALGRVLLPTSVTYLKNGKRVMHANKPTGAIEEHVHLNPKLRRKDFRPE